MGLHIHPEGVGSPGGSDRPETRWDVDREVARPHRGGKDPPRPAWSSYADDIGDPIGRPSSVMQATADILRDQCERLVNLLFWS